MAHWSEKYVGRPYVPGEYDCAELAMEVARVEFGMAVDMLSERAIGVREQSEQIDMMQADFAQPTDDPHDGDPVLMRCRGLLAHVGVLCVIGGERYVLHAMRNAGMVCLHPMRRLRDVNLQIEGYYKWKV